jgi:hypothetical protein
MNTKLQFVFGQLQVMCTVSYMSFGVKFCVNRYAFLLVEYWKKKIFFKL